MTLTPGAKNYHSYFFSLVAFALSFPVKIPVYALLICGIYVVVSTTKSSWRQLFKFNEEYILIPYLFVLVISALFSEQKFLLIKQLEIRSSFLLLPILFVLSKSQLRTKQDLNRIFEFFVYGVFTASLLCISFAFYNSTTFLSGSFIFDPSVKDHDDFLLSTVYGGNYFFSSDLSKFMHPTYFSIYSLFSICIIINLTNEKKFRRSLAIVGVTWLVFFIFLLSSRAVLLTVPGLLFVSAIILLIKEKLNSKLALIGMMGALFLLVLFFSNPRLHLLFDSEELFDRNPRVQIWKNGWNVVKESPVFGHGILDVQMTLDRQYEKSGFVEGLNEHYNLHNQYLESLAQSGIFGLSSLILMLYFLGKASRDNFLAMAFILLIAVNLLAESMLNVFAGVSFFCFMYCLLWRSNQIES